MSTAERIDPAAFHDMLVGFSGTDQWHRHGFCRWFVWTDGVEAMAGYGGAYWLIDLICSYQPKLIKHPLCRDFQVWKLTPRPDRGPNAAVAECFPDSNTKPVVRQFIEYTDFPFSMGSRSIRSGWSGLALKTARC